MVQTYSARESPSAMTNSKTLAHEAFTTPTAMSAGGSTPRSWIIEKQKQEIKTY